jgi:hypothetical protein
VENELDPLNAHNKAQCQCRFISRAAPLEWKGRLSFMKPGQIPKPGAQVLEYHTLDVFSKATMAYKLICHPWAALEVMEWAS